MALSFAFPLLVTGGTEEPTPVTYVLLFAMYITLAFVTIFFKTTRGAQPGSRAALLHETPDRHP
ncbi:MAG: hypothetical protein ACNA8R_09775 [Nitriliruptoraceae bacterium]